jgi:hypothetical protein
MLIQIEINDHLMKNVAAQILWNAVGTTLDTYFVPKNLLGAMWLQFARALIWPPEESRQEKNCAAAFEWSRVAASTRTTLRQISVSHSKKMGFGSLVTKAIMRRTLVLARPSETATRNATCFVRSSSAGSISFARVGLSGFGGGARYLATPCKYYVNCGCF